MSCVPKINKTSSCTPKERHTKFHVPFDGAEKLQHEIDELEGKELHHSQFGHYKTTHKIDFPGYDSGLYAEAHRPPENGAKKSIEPPAKSQFTTTAGRDFSWKKCNKEEPIRSGTASGQRRNNPHPHEAFMTWKLNKSKLFVNTDEVATTDDDKLLQQILRDQVTSTYQQDFLDNSSNIKEMRTAAEHELTAWKNPQPNKKNKKSERPECYQEWRKRVSEDFQTSQHLSTNRVNYGQPIHHPHLDDNTTRYGCNRNKMNAASGVVPTVIQYNAKNLSTKTTSYQAQFGAGQREE